MTPVDESLLKPLEDVVLQKLVPALTGQFTPNGNTRALLALPVRLCSMWIVNATTLLTVQDQSSVVLCKPLCGLLDSQELHANMAAACKDKAAIKGPIDKETLVGLGERSGKCHSGAATKSTTPCSGSPGEGHVLLAVRPALPIKSFGFALHKGAFKDAVALRYGWPLHVTPSRCRCGVPFDIDHVMSCRHGGFQSLQHNETRNLLAGLFAEVCSDICVEPRP